MTSKPNESQYAWQRAQRLCAEVEIGVADAELATALMAKMHLDPSLGARAEPPPGYEDRLVAALMAKAEDVVADMTPPKDLYGETGAELPWYRFVSKLIPVTVFSFVVVIGFGLFQVFFKAPTASPAQNDLWAVAVADASEVEVSRWLASVSDGGAQLISTSSDLMVLGTELSERQLERVLKAGGGT